MVLSSQCSLIDFNISPSFKVSKLLVGSSSNNISPLLKNALASPFLCFSPADNLPPSSPTRVSYPFGSVSINLLIDAFLTASITSSLVAFSLPILIFFSLTVTQPLVTSYLFSINDAIVLLPLPLSPTIATSPPDVIFMFILSKTFLSLL